MLCSDFLSPLLLNTSHFLLSFFFPSLTTFSSLFISYSKTFCFLLFFPPPPKYITVLTTILYSFSYHYTLYPLLIFTVKFRGKTVNARSPTPRLLVQFKPPCRPWHGLQKDCRGMCVCVCLCVCGGGGGGW